MAKKAMAVELFLPLGSATLLLIGCAILEDGSTSEYSKRAYLAAEKRDRPVLVKFFNFL